MFISFGVLSIYVKFLVRVKGDILVIANGVTGIFIGVRRFTLGGLLARFKSFNFL